jgi:hypothetical protein
MRKNVFVLMLSFSVALSSISARAEQFLREQKVVNADGQEEVWRLFWDGKPTPACSVVDYQDAITCPCNGLAYGETGRLILNRSRNGREIEQVDLGSLLADVRGTATMALQHWPRFEESDDKLYNQSPQTLQSAIEQRSAVPVMEFQDYDHNGSPSEFLIQVGTEPCGRPTFAAIGVSKRNPQIHFLATEAHPEKPLVMFGYEWQDLLKGPGRHVEMNWTCEDHGGDQYVDEVISAEAGKIRAEQRAFACTNAGGPGKLLSRSLE